MAKQDINVGSAPNANDGDDLRGAFLKTKSNFDELYLEKADAGPVANSGLRMTAPGLVGRSAAGEGAVAQLSASQAKALLLLDQVNNTADADKPISTAVQTALAGKEPTIEAAETSPTGKFWRGDKTWATLNKNAVGLSNVDDTADADKPISTATQAALDLKANTAHTHVPVDIQMSTQRILGRNTAGNGGAEELTGLVVKAIIGLGLVDNTSDANKPISTATQAALDNKAAKVHTHVISDVTGLQEALDGKLNSGAAISVSDVIGLQDELNEKVNSSDLALALDTKAEATHTHVAADITDLLDVVAAKTHTHDIEDITGLQDSLDGKLNTGALLSSTTGNLTIDRLEPGNDGQFLSVVGGVVTWVAAPNGGSSGPIAITDVTGLQDALDAKADDVHTHVISDVAGLQTALDSLQENIDAVVIPHSVKFVVSGNTPVMDVASDAFTIDISKSVARSSIANTDEMVLDISKNGLGIGTITFASGLGTGVIQITEASDLDLVMGDVLTISFNAESTAQNTVAPVGIVFHN
jgi:hypothetical protein